MLSPHLGNAVFLSEILSVEAENLWWLFFKVFRPEEFPAEVLVRSSAVARVSLYGLGVFLEAGGSLKSYWSVSKKVGLPLICGLLKP